MSVVYKGPNAAFTTSCSPCVAFVYIGDQDIRRERERERGGGGGREGGREGGKEGGRERERERERERNTSLNTTGDMYPPTGSYGGAKKNYI